MAYDASLHATTNKSVGIAQGVPTDARSYFYDTDTYSYRPYANTGEVLGYLNTAASRTGNFSIYVSDGEGGVTEYWFNGGTADGNLVVKSIGGGGGSTPPTAPTDSFDL